MKKTLLIFASIISLLISFAGYAQKIEIPIRWKTGDTWTYDLKKRNLGGMMGGDKYARMSFQVKVVTVNPESKPGYVVEWKYLSYNTFETDTLEDECATVFKQFLLKTPLLLSLNEKGVLQNRIGKADLKKKMLAFYAEQSKKLRSTVCLDNLKSMLELAGDEEDYIEVFTPEIQNFFPAFSLLPAETSYRKDTVEVLTNVLEAGKTSKVPKIISGKAASTFANTVEVDRLAKISEAEYKKVFVESSRAMWDKLGLEKGDGMRKSLEEQMEEFQPKKAHTLHAVFDKSNGSVVQFDTILEEWLTMKGGESIFYYFSRQ
ncbi:hypothetical protein [Emticicia agri]|uniref:Uncharacterized protein n=1 Tax=Emticicia agri TaxID=2492393 RepID=A0A4Q5LU59_9BACT|nr:hypothetical protein [Emticicia agri]RYU93198.1 hypothetical protein EWM59_23265 [Emticicia agri]